MPPHVSMAIDEQAWMKSPVHQDEPNSAFAANVCFDRPDKILPTQTPPATPATILVPGGWWWGSGKCVVLKQKF